MKVVEFYKGIGRYDRVVIYEKILRKAKVTKASPETIRCLSEKARQDYREAVDYYLKNAERLSRENYSELVEFEKLLDFYQIVVGLDDSYRRSLSILGIPVDTYWDEIFLAAKKKKIALCLSFGENLARQRRFREARIFYTTTMTEYFTPVEVLQILGDLYDVPEKKMVREKIWGKNIFVVLEDFENTTRPVISNWATSNYPRVKAHEISGNEFYTGSQSEYFDLRYASPGWDYWAKRVDIPLAAKNRPMGVRFYLKSRGPFKGCLRFTVVMGGDQKRTGIWHEDEVRDAERGWQMRWVDDVYQKAVLSATKSGIPAENLRIDQIIINTDGHSNQFYVDDIELYLLPAGRS